MTGREHGTLHFYRKYGAKIVRKYRGESRKSIDRDIPGKKQLTSPSSYSQGAVSLNRERIR